ncbi:hypothetical protein ABID30_003200 [Enterococcus rotai]|uniref:hypothetical protein n=1 Tax=Enterococcus rotai TaxID=118060 RepID=UPI0033965769
MKIQKYIFIVCTVVFIVMTGCSDQKQLEEYRTKLSSVEEKMKKDQLVENHGLATEKKEYGINERVVITKANQPLVAFTITKVSSNLDTLRKDVTYSDEVKHVITVSVTYENINYPDPYEIRWTLVSNSKIIDSNNDVVNLGSRENNKDINKGETNTMTFSVKTKELASKVDYLTFKYYYPQSLLRGTYSEKDFLIIKVPVEH